MEFVTNNGVKLSDNKTVGEVVDDAKETNLRFAKKVESAVVGKVDGKKGAGGEVKQKKKSVPKMIIIRLSTSSTNAADEFGTSVERAGQIYVAMKEWYNKLNQISVPVTNQYFKNRSFKGSSFLLNIRQNNGEE
ncbi:hypothetical protein [Peribacillus huizhouensis]|uniref:Uncharacterized protein n=1 Tax=Peribacillus huizhouensis TaxID=1501239 RepID=A0ABR6CKQ7_9BACI|nr:hypothetical protein [Peribacillus huizhouensis]MBA9025634.1 hypothetical protein [Peribacillus huizhouensis]